MNIPTINIPTLGKPKPASKRGKQDGVCYDTMKKEILSNADRYLSGKATAKEIAAEIGCSNIYFYKVLWLNDIEKPKKFEAVLAYADDYANRLISRREIARKVGCALNYVSHIMSAHGYSMKSTKELLNDLGFDECRKRLGITEEELTDRIRRW